MMLITLVILMPEESAAENNCLLDGCAFQSILGDSTKQDSSTLSLGDTVITLRTSKSALKSKVKYSAKDSIRLDAAGKIVHLFGDAHIDYEDMVLDAEYISINFRTKVVYAEGRPDSSGKNIGLPVFVEGGQEYKSENMSYNFDTKKGKLNRLITEEGGGIIRGNEVKKDPENNVYVKAARYTTCDAEHPHFYIEASKLKIIPDNKIVTGPANLVIEDVRTPLVLPFGFFPIKKGQSSGLLVPTYGESVNQGFFLRGLGYYFALTDHVDLAVRTDVYSRGSWGVNTASVYSKRYKYNGNFSLSYAKNQFGEPETPSFSSQRNFFIRWNHTMDRKARPNTNFSASVNAGSSRYLSINSYDPSAIVTGQLNSTVAYSRSFGQGKYNLSSNLRHSQNTNTQTVNLSLPDIAFNVSRFFPFKRKVQSGGAKWYDNLGVSYTMNFRNEISTFDSLLFRRETLDEMRNGFSHTIPISTSLKVLKYFTLSPSANYTEFWYLQSVSKRWDADSGAIITDQVPGFTRGGQYNGSVSLRTILYGQWNFARGKIKAIRHVMTPNISYSYRPDFSEGRFGFYRQVQSDSAGTTFQEYSIFEGGLLGGPGSGRVGTMTFSLNNNLEMKVLSRKDTAEEVKKIKIFESLNLSSGYNFLLDSLNLSNIGITARTVLFKNVSIQMNGTLDPYVIDSLGRRFNKFEWNENNRLGRLTAASIALSTSLTPETFRRNLNSDKGTEEENRLIRNHYEAYYDFNVPWSLSVNYALNYTKPGLDKILSQTLNFAGDMSITPQWKLGFTSGYDFRQKDMTYTSFDLVRDLHCWEFKFTWVPFGFRQSYFFQINVRSSVLQDLKLTRRRDWFDNQ